MSDLCSHEFVPCIHCGDGSVSDLREALDYYEPQGVGTGRLWNALLAAARRFLALTETGQRVEWCEEHGSRFKDGPGGNPGLGRCDVAEIWKLANDEVKKMCRPIPVLVIPADYLTEEET